MVHTSLGSPRVLGRRTAHAQNPTRRCGFGFALSKQAEIGGAPQLAPRGARVPFEASDSPRCQGLSVCCASFSISTLWVAMIAWLSL